MTKVKSSISVILSLSAALISTRAPAQQTSPAQEIYNRQIIVEQGIKDFTVQSEAYLKAFADQVIWWQNCARDKTCWEWVRPKESEPATNPSK